MDTKLVSIILFTLSLTGCATICDTTIRTSVSRSVGGDISRYNDGVNYHGATVGRVELDVPFYRTHGFTLSAMASHESLLDTSHDRGEERAGLTVQFQPWGAR